MSSSTHWGFTATQWEMQMWVNHSMKNECYYMETSYQLPVPLQSSDDSQSGSLARSLRRPGGSSWCLQHKHTLQVKFGLNSHTLYSIRPKTWNHTTETSVTQKVCVSVCSWRWVLRGTAPANRSGWLLSSLCLSSVCPQLGGPISAIGRFLLAGWWYRAISSYVRISSLSRSGLKERTEVAVNSANELLIQPENESLNILHYM